MYPFIPSCTRYLNRKYAIHYTWVAFYQVGIDGSPFMNWSVPLFEMTRISIVMHRKHFRDDTEADVIGSSAPLRLRPIGV